MELSTCIALGVGEDRLQEAADFYEKKMGMKRAQAKDDWVEMQSGPLRLFLIGDSQGTPTFEYKVADVDATVESLLAAGCVEETLCGSPGERFVRTPYGHYFCVTPA